MSFDYELLDRQYTRPLELEDLFDEDNIHYEDQLNLWLTKLDYEPIDELTAFGERYYNATVIYIKYILHKHQRIFANHWYKSVESSWGVSRSSAGIQDLADQIKAFHSRKFIHLINPADGIPVKPYSTYLKKRDQFHYVVKMLSKELINHKSSKSTKLLNRKNQAAYSIDSDLSILLR
jgi:hypothetical protein